MILYNRLFYIFLLLLICNSGIVKSQENLLDFTHSLRFARYLAASGQFKLAAEEFERINFLWPGDTSVVLELARSYRLGNNCEKIKTSFNLLSGEERVFRLPAYSREFLAFALHCRYTDPVYFKVASVLSNEENAFYYTAWFWMNSKFDSLNLINRKYGELLTRRYPDLNKLTTDFIDVRYKKPALALFMSAIIPGSGKAYTKNWGDALVSLLFVGTNSYASCRAFKKKGTGSINGWIFGGLAISFYSANLWGSHKAAVKYNNDLKSQYLKNAESIIFNTY